jgi:branched-chain amino acid transport system permease protein
VLFPDIFFRASDVIAIGGIYISVQYLVIFLTSIAIIVLIELFVRKTIWGHAVKAVALDPELGTVFGIPVNFIVTISFIVSGLLAGIAGILVAQIGGTVNPAFGFELVLLGFVSAVIGGMGSLPGALLGGLLVGVIGKLVGGYISTAAEHGIAFALLMLILAVRPNGLLSRAEATKV